MFSEKILIEILKRRRMTIDELSNIVKIPSNILYREIKKYREYIEIIDEEIFLKKSIDLAILLAKKGVSIKQLSRYLDWRDFEKVSAEILSMNRYIVKTNYRVFKPVRFEIDVIGIDPGSGRGIFIDCKHWSRGLYQKPLIDIVEKHVSRIKKFIKYYEWFINTWYYFKYLKTIIPLIITLTTPPMRYYMDTLIVSIQELNQFLVDIHTVLEVFNIEPYRVGEAVY